MQTMQAQRLLLLAGTQIFLAAMLQLLLSTGSHSLGDAQGWTSSKAGLARGVMGAQSFIDENQAVGRNRLDLSAWHGFQEVILDRTMQIDAVEFDFRLERGAYLVFVLNKNDEGFAGIRLSAAPRFPSIVFRAESGGGFLERLPIHEGPVAPLEWHHASIRFAGHGIVLQLNDDAPQQIEIALDALQKIGFRGGLHETLIDGVVVSGDQRIEEDFGQAFSGLGFLALLAALIALEGGLLWIRSRRREGPRDEPTSSRPVFALVALNGVLITIGAASWAYLYFLAPASYPLAVTQQANEERFRLMQAEAVRQEIRQKHATAKAPDGYRILVIGTSQTWGAGVEREEDIFCRRLEELLEKEERLGRSIECVNAGISAVSSQELIADYYVNEWIDLAPDTVIVNLGNNDTDLAAFERNLDLLARLNAERGIRTLFVAEANASEREFAGMTGPLKRKHRILEKVAKEHGIPFVDMHRHLLAHYDDGFLWWDLVHLTSKGHELVARKLYQELIRDEPF